LGETVMLNKVARNGVLSSADAWQLFKSNSGLEKEME
jgi:hypothetical protein